MPYALRPHIELERPGRERLSVEAPEGVSDFVDLQHSLCASLLLDLRKLSIHLVAVDHSVDDDMPDVEALRAELARHSVRDRAMRRLGGCEGGEP
jgi:hypothetical protein